MCSSSCMPSFTTYQITNSHGPFVVLAGNTALVNLFDIKCLDICSGRKQETLAQCCYNSRSASHTLGQCVTWWGKHGILEYRIWNLILFLCHFLTHVGLIGLVWDPLIKTNTELLTTSQIPQSTRDVSPSLSACWHNVNDSVPVLIRQLTSALFFLRRD